MKQSDIRPTELRRLEQTMAQLRREHQQLVAGQVWCQEAQAQQALNRQIQQNESRSRQLQQQINRQYQQQIALVTPRAPVAKNVLRAFWVGGFICTLGQLLILLYTYYGGLDFAQAAPLASVTIVIITGLLTGLGIYDEVGRYGGAGSMVPITGFANSIVSAALEYRREGMIYGVGARIFTIAGPVILYGTVTSVVIGCLYYIWR